ncbi:hypothetical protein ABL840_21705 [Variovorax sp. NFACC27]|uniref:hypothetical protein n=1 Tax=unclassified Variovorax TaxID=663243 RepID=UPI000B87F2B9
MDATVHGLQFSGKPEGGKLPAAPTQARIRRKVGCIHFSKASIGLEVQMGIVFAENWDNIDGLRAKHGDWYDDDYNTLGDANYQQICAMLNTWAEREIAHNHASELYEIATAVLSDRLNVTVELGFHQLQNFKGQDYFHITVIHPDGWKAHMFSRAKIYMGQIAHIEKTIEGGTKVPTVYEKRIYLQPQKPYTPFL